MACGGSDPEANLEQANRAVEEVRDQVEEARESVRKLETLAEEAQKQLADARSALREAESELARRAEAVDRSATDDVLFRTVQRRLLEDDDLSDVAIAARVSEGVVTLSGTVPDAALRDRALEVARETPGVGNVESRIAVQVAAPKGEDR
jgi:osmotically-inducible protein OsmY